MNVCRLIRATAAAAAAALFVAPPLHGSAANFFDDQSVATFTIEAPLQQLFDRGRDDSFAIQGRVLFGEAGTSDAVDADVSIRGNTSRKECLFPKLKLKLKHDEAGPFAGIHAIKINTHCGEAPGEQLSAQFGRLANEKSPWREAVVYRIAQAAGARTPRTRLARITYVDKSASLNPQRLTRNALIVEDDDDVKRRLGATGEIAPAEFTNARELFTPDDVGRVAFTQALIGNFDWCLMMEPEDRYRCDRRRKLWNMAALRTPSGAIPVLEDFDLAGPVTGGHVWFDHAFPREFSASAIETEVIAQVQRTRTLFDRAMLDRMRQDFQSRRDAINSAIAAAPVDAHGAQLAQAYVDAFFRAIGADADFYRPVVASSGVRIFAAATGDAEVCGAGDTIPPGTPVNELRRENGRAEVQLLDALWRWAPPTECVPVHKAPVWIDPASISRAFPRS